MAKLGDRVVYTTPENQHTETINTAKPEGEQRMKGSIHHPEQRVFAGTVGRVHDDGRSADLWILVPGRAARWVDGIAEGAGAGEFVVCG